MARELKIAFTPPILRCRLLLWIILFGLMIPASALAQEVTLRSGDTLKGEIIEHTETQIILEHPDLGRITIPSHAIETISGAADPEGVSETQVAEGAPVEPEQIPKAKAVEEPEERRSNWKLGLVFAGTFTNDDDGEKLSYNTRASADRKVPGSETELSLSYLYKLDNDEVDEDELTGILRQRWLKMDSPRLYYATGRYDHDEFRSWQHRLQGHGGVGYRIIDKETLRVTPMVGLGFRKDVGSEEEAFPAEAAAGLNFNWESKSKQTVSLELIYFRAITDSESRFVTIADWKVPLARLSRRGQLSFNTHLDYEYATDPDPGYPLNNISLNWGLQWDF